MPGSQLWTTGPAHLFAGLGGGNAPLYVGTSESPPRIEIHPHFFPVRNDIAGVAGVPYDKMWQGDLAIIAYDLNRYDESVFRMMQSRPNPSGVRGTAQAGDWSTFMGQEGMAYPAWVQFPYSAKGSMAGMPAGYRFFRSWMAGPDTMVVGNLPRKNHIVIAAFPVFSVGVNNTIASVTWDENMSGLPQVS